MANTDGDRRNAIRDFAGVLTIARTGNIVDSPLHGGVRGSNPLGSTRKCAVLHQKRKANLPIISHSPVPLDASVESCSYPFRLYHSGPPDDSSGRLPLPNTDDQGRHRRSFSCGEVPDME